MRRWLDTCKFVEIESLASPAPANLQSINKTLCVRNRILIGNFGISEEASFLYSMLEFHMYNSGQYGSTMWSKAVNQCALI
jgi:hypothetical protein